MKVELLNGFYLMYILLFIVFTILIELLLKNKSDKFRKNFIIILAFCGFTLHFLKQAFPPYNSDFPYSLRKSSFENICAVSTLIFPFIFLGKNTRWRDYMCAIGLISGIFAFLFPTEAFDKFPFTFDVMRFYFCHYVIFLVPYLTLRYKYHVLKIERFYNVPLTFIEVQGIILINEIILIAIGFVDCDMNQLLSAEYRNSSIIFGIPDAIKPFSKLVEIFVPSFMERNVNGDLQYWPILWSIIPMFIYETLLVLIVCLIFNNKETINTFKRILKKYIIKNEPLKIVEVDNSNNNEENEKENDL